MSEPRKVSTLEALDAILLLHESESGGGKVTVDESTVAAPEVRLSAENTLIRWHAQLPESDSDICIASDCDGSES